MALYCDLPVFRDVYRLIKDIKRDGIVLVRSIYRVKKAKDKKE
ncbi:MAG: hypothetical protein WCT14_05635 [Treponemataceae bacterium]